MRRAIIFTLITGSISACTDETTDDCLPGDIDCADDAGGGKGDGWDEGNNPEVFAKRLEYRLEKLPKKGWRDTPVWKDKYPEAVGRAETVWADTYWPSDQGSHNARWQGPSIKSPLEKYDAAFNGAPGCDTQPKLYGPNVKPLWDVYNQCAGPAARWQTSMYQQIGFMHDGIDNDNDGVIDDSGGTGIDGVEGWWGTCHAWTPASLMIPEPLHAAEINGVRFEVGDIKAIIQNAFDFTESIMLGGRCNAQTITHDVNGSANDECADVNPGALHVVMTNFLGIHQLALIEDKTANKQVWNQPVVGYEVTRQDLVNAEAANTCVGASGSSWSYNPDATELYEVQMVVSYVIESSASVDPVGYRNYVARETYHYILEVGSTGKVLGGRYCTDTTNHIDFLWAPTGWWRSTNPNIDVLKVKQLIKASITPA